MQRKLVQTVEQVFPEPSFGYRLFQILIGAATNRMSVCISSLPPTGR